MADESKLPRSRIGRPAKRKDGRRSRVAAALPVQSNHPRTAHEKRARFMNLNIRRRNVLVGAGIGLAATVLAACTAGKKSAGSDAETTAAQSGSPAAPAPGAALTKTADVPVGSGVIVDDIVVTQPTAGKFEAFSSVCTHAGCNVSEVTDGLITCPCHGSKFNLDGTVSHGPAKSPLESKVIRVQGDSIVAG
jgi:Rieske Fe-S protein